jgi:hypothetical protein
MAFSRTAALRSVVAVSSDGKVTTGFAFGPSGRVVTVDVAGRPVTTDARGRATQASVVVRRDGLMVLSTTAKLRPLHLAPAQGKRHTQGWVLLAPVGLHAKKIVPTRIATAKKTVSVRGSLPANAVGAPVVDAAGRIIGLVGSGAHGVHSLVAGGEIAQLISAKPDSGNGTALWQILAGSLAALLLASGCALVLIRRRRRAFAVAARGAGSSPTAEQPLVQRRGPEPEPETDFEVVVKSREAAE